MGTPAAKITKHSVEGNDRLTAYRITADSAPLVQREIDQIMNARCTAHATFSFPIRDGERFVSVGTVLSYEKETA